MSKSGSKQNKAIIKEVYKFLCDNHVAALATSFQNSPQVSVVYYFVDKDLNFYFLTKRGTEKYKNIALNHSVAITVGYGPALINVKAKGEAEILYDKEKLKSLKTIQGIITNKKKWPINELAKFKEEVGPLLKSEVVVKVKPTSLYFFNLDNKKYKTSISDKEIKII